MSLYVSSQSECLFFYKDPSLKLDRLLFSFILNFFDFLGIIENSYTQIVYFNDHFQPFLFQTYG